MPFSHWEFNAFIHENEFCRLLYDFLEDNQDQVLHKDNDDVTIYFSILPAKK